MGLKDMIGSSIMDIPCPKCGSENTYEYDVDESELSYDGTGHYYVDCHCKNCENNFRAFFEIEYKVTKAHY